MIIYRYLDNVIIKWNNKTIILLEIFNLSISIKNIKINCQNNNTAP